MSDTDPESQPEAEMPPDHSMWTHLVKAGANAADAAVDIAAIAAIAVMATEGVDPALLQTTGAMVASIAVGKRYMAGKFRS